MQTRGTPLAVISVSIARLRMGRRATADATDTGLSANDFTVGHVQIPTKPEDTNAVATISPGSTTTMATMGTVSTTATGARVAGSTATAPPGTTRLSTAASSARAATAAHTTLEATGKNL